MADKNITSDIITLSVPAQLENLHMIRYVVLHAAMQFGFSSEDAAKVEMAADEACTNVILHGYGDQAKKEPYPPLFLNFLFDKEKLIIEIADQAKRFSPIRQEPPAIENLHHRRQKGGLGIYIMNSLMDEISHNYSEDAGGNVLQLIKFLHGPANSSAPAT